MENRLSPDHRIKLVKNTFYSGITTSAGILLLFLMILSGRYLGSNDFGIFSFGLALATVFAIITNLGLDELTVRDVARNKESAGEYLGNILAWKSILSIFALFAIFVTVNILKSSVTIRVVTYLLGLMAILRSFIMTIRAFFRALEQFDLEAILVMVDRVTLFVLAAAFLLIGQGVIVLACVFVFVRFGTILFALTMLHKRVANIHPKFDPQFIKAFQIKALPFGFAFLCFGLYTSLDKIILSLTRSEAEVGLYNAGFQIYQGIKILPAILCSVLYPRLSQLFVMDKRRHLDLFSRGMKYLIVLALPIAACGVLFSEDIIGRLFGNEFLDATVALSILLCGLVLTFQNGLLHTFLNSINKQKYMFYTTLIGLGTAISLDLLLIPTFGITGAAVAMVGCAAAIFSASYLYIYFKFYRVSVIQILWKPLLSVVVISALLWHFIHLSLLLSFVLFVLLYVLALLCFKVFDNLELDTAYRFVKQLF